MKVKTTAYIIANFGGPRNLPEVTPFLKALLTDQDVVQTTMPRIIHRYLFGRIATKRSPKVSKDYEFIGGKSPIFGDTEAVAEILKKQLNAPIYTFHRYLPATHDQFIRDIRELRCDEIRIFPMFPQFTYATTGSIARWFSENLPEEFTNKMRWIKSYAAHPAFIQAQQKCISNFLIRNNLKEEDTVLLFSAHGVPQKYIAEGDLYEDECIASYKHIMEAFPKVLGKLCYQSKFGKGEWLRPYTLDASKEILEWHEGRPNIVFVPISFTSDHLETLFEVEKEYVPLIEERNLKAFRVPALTLDPQWIKAILEIMQETNLCNNQMLIRRR